MTEPPANPTDRVVPEYQSPGASKTHIDAFPPIKMAIWCGAIPLVAGTLIFILWLLTRAGFLQLLGFLTILAGMVLVGGGGILWLAHLIGTLRRLESSARRKQLALSCLAIIVLLSNFPACFFILAAVTRIETSFVVEVRNTGTLQVTNAAITYDGTTYRLGAVPPGAAVEQRLHLQGGPVMVIVTRADGSTSSVALEIGDEDDVHGGQTRYRAVVEDMAMKTQPH